MHSACARHRFTFSFFLFNFQRKLCRRLQAPPCLDVLRLRPRSTLKASHPLERHAYAARGTHNLSQSRTSPRCSPLINSAEASKRWSDAGALDAHPAAASQKSSLAAFLGLGVRGVGVRPMGRFSCLTFLINAFYFTYFLIDTCFEQLLGLWKT